MKLASTLCSITAFFAVCRGSIAEVECHLPLDVMFVQDTTGSFTEDLPNVVKQIPDMLTDITSRYPNSRFGVAEFHDKPFFPLGIEGDFCYKLGGSLTDNMEEFKAAYSLLYASGGSDGPEASYHALIDVLEDETVRWRPLGASRSGSSDPSVAGARVVILSTDAVPHLPNDYIRLYDHKTYPKLPDHLEPYSGSTHPVPNGQIDWQCVSQDYPSPDQLLAAYKKHSAYLVILTPEDPSITAAWRWVNNDLFQQADGFYQYIKSDSSNILESVLSALEAVTTTACASTTNEPTLSAETTTLTTSTTGSTTLTASTTPSTSQTGDSTREPSVASSSPTTLPATTSTMPSPETTDLLKSEGAGVDGDCCPHVEIQMMQAPKQWKMEVMN